MCRLKTINCVAPMALALLLSPLFAAASRAQEKGNIQWISLEKNKATDKIEHALASETSLEFIETPLQDVFDFLEDLHGIQIEIDSRALDLIGIGSDTPITRNVKGISLRSALRLILRDLDLTYLIADEVLQITTREAAEQRSIVRVYITDGLLDQGETADELAIVLSDVVRQAPKLNAKRRDPLDPPVPARQRITPFGKLLIVRDTTEGHEQLLALLQAMQHGRDAAKSENPAAPTILPLPAREPNPPANDAAPPAPSPTEGD